MLLGISTSGNSGNVIKAIAAAREKGMKVITLTGKDGGKMAGTADIEIRVPHFGYADRIQEIHIKVIHILIQLIEKRWLKLNQEGDFICHFDPWAVPEILTYCVYAPVSVCCPCPN